MSKKTTARDEETLIGIVTPVQWEDDQVTAVALCATDDEEYFIENSDKFLGLIQKCIAVTGRVRRGNKAFRSISITQFNIIDSF